MTTSCAVSDGNVIGATVMIVAMVVLVVATAGAIWEEWKS